MHTHVCEITVIILTGPLWVVRHILIDGRYKLDGCTIIITCTKKPGKSALISAAIS